MDVTDNYQIPFPQCAPPLVKDASDIEQMRDLAERADQVVQDYADRITHEITRPDAARLFNNTPLVSTNADNVFFLDAITFDNTDGLQMSDTANGVIRIVRSGWYYLSCWIESVVATNVSTRVRFIANGSPITNFQGPSGLAEAGIQHLNVENVAHLVAGDGITVESRNGFPGTSVTYTARVAVQLVSADG